MVTKRKSTAPAARRGELDRNQLLREIGSSTASIIVGPIPQTFLVDKALISLHSPFFRQRLYGLWASKHTSEVILDDTLPSTFELFLHWMLRKGERDVFTATPASPSTSFSSFNSNSNSNSNSYSTPNSDDNTCPATALSLLRLFVFSEKYLLPTLTSDVFFPLRQTFNSLPSHLDKSFYVEALTACGTSPIRHFITLELIYNDWKESDPLVQEMAREDHGVAVDLLAFKSFMIRERSVRTPHRLDCWLTGGNARRFLGRAEMVEGGMIGEEGEG